GWKPGNAFRLVQSSASRSLFATGCSFFMADSSASQFPGMGWKQFLNCTIATLQTRLFLILSLLGNFWKSKEKKAANRTAQLERPTAKQPRSVGSISAFVHAAMVTYHVKLGQRSERERERVKRQQRRDHLHHR